MARPKECAFCFEPLAECICDDEPTSGSVAGVSESSEMAERISDRPIFECCQGRGYHLMFCRNNTGRDENLRQMALQHEAEQGSATGRLNIYPDAVTPALLGAVRGDLITVNDIVYRVTEVTRDDNGTGSVTFGLVAYEAGPEAK